MRATTRFLLQSSLEVLETPNNERNKHNTSDTQETEDSAFDTCPDLRNEGNKERVVIVESVDNQTEWIDISDGFCSIKARLHPRLEKSLKRKTGYHAVRMLRGYMIRLDRYLFQTADQCYRLDSDIKPINIGTQSTDDVTLCLCIVKMKVLDTLELAPEPAKNINLDPSLQKKIKGLHSAGLLQKCLLDNQNLEDDILVSSKTEDVTLREEDCIIPDEQEAQLEVQEGWEDSIPKQTDSELIAGNESSIECSYVSDKNLQYAQIDIRKEFEACREPESDECTDILDPCTEVKEDDINDKASARRNETNLSDKVSPCSQTCDRMRISTPNANKSIAQHSITIEKRSSLIESQRTSIQSTYSSPGTHVAKNFAHSTPHMDRSSCASADIIAHKQQSFSTPRSKFLSNGEVLDKKTPSQNKLLSSGRKSTSKDSTVKSMGSQKQRVTPTSTQPAQINSRDTTASQKTPASQKVARRLSRDLQSPQERSHDKRLIRSTPPNQLTLHRADNSSGVCRLDVQSYLHFRSQKISTRNNAAILSEGDVRPSKRYKHLIPPCDDLLLKQLLQD